MQYSESTIYGFNLILREYAHFPKLLPLPCHFEHGWTCCSRALRSDLEVDKPLMLVFSKRRRRAWLEAGKTPAYIMGSPFIHYKNMRKVAKISSARGTVAYPSHSTADIKSTFNVREYCKQLKELPKQFQPVTVCLFWPDFVDKNADIYREFGFLVTTAGPGFKKGLGFAKNFYKILSKHQYATSNEIGSYTFYAVDLKIPFFLQGEIPLIVNTKGLNRDIDATAKLDDEFYGRQAIKMFSTGPTTEITPGQAKFVQDEMGLTDCLTPAQMNKLFWDNFKKDEHRLKGVLIYWIISILLFLGLANWVLSVLKFFKRLGRTA